MQNTSMLPHSDILDNFGNNFFMEPWTINLDMFVWGVARSNVKIQLNPFKTALSSRRSTAGGKLAVVDFGMSFAILQRFLTYIVID